MAILHKPSPCLLPNPATACFKVRQNCCGHRSPLRCIRRAAGGGPICRANAGATWDSEPCPQEGLDIAIREATVADYFAIAEVHAQSFYPSANWFFGPLLRLDRVQALQFGVDGKLKAQRGQFLCLVAHRQGACHADESPDQAVLSGTPGAAVPPFFKFLLSEPLRAGFELSPERLGLVGAIVVDMQGTFLPMTRVEKGPFVAYERPEDVAYISNLAVAPSARRQGVGERLLAAAEEVALSWQCKRICLHYDPSNAAASALYAKFGYTAVSSEPQWMSWLQGRPTVRLQLMQKDVVEG